MTASGHPMTARNYEFNDEAEDFTVIKTCIKGKYTHIGTSVLGIGRDDGINEMGLTVTLSSSGFPVGPLPEMRRPAVTGLQFWAVVRTLLENCRDVKEALSMLKDMPVAYNLHRGGCRQGGRIFLLPLKPPVLRRPRGERGQLYKKAAPVPCCQGTGLHGETRH